MLAARPISSEVCFTSGYKDAVLSERPVPVGSGSGQGEGVISKVWWRAREREQGEAGGQMGQREDPAQDAWPSSSLPCLTKTSSVLGILNSGCRCKEKLDPLS